MQKKYIFMGIGASLLVTVFLFFQFYVPHRIKRYLNTEIAELSHIEGKIGGVDISFFGSDWILREIDLVSNSGASEVTLEMEKAILHDVDWYRIVYQNSIAVGSIKCVKPNVKITKTDTVRVRNKLQKTSIEIGDIELEGGAITLFDEQKKDTLFGSAISQVRLNAITTDRSTPFYFHSSLIDRAEFTHLHAKVNEFDVLRIRRLSFKNNGISALDLSLSTEFDKARLSKILKTERDHTDFKLDVLEMEHIDFQIADGLTSLSSRRVLLSDFDLAIYRDKLLPDDTRRKRYYGASLRDLPFRLDVTTVVVRNGRLNYAEKVKMGIKPENLVFQNISGKFNNLHNFKDSQTDVELSTQIMGEAALDITFQLHPLNVRETFLLEGSVTSLNAASVNPFLRTSTGTMAQGYVDRMYFTVDGNSTRARGDVKMKYKNFKIQILKKDFLKINKVLSFLGNLILNDGSKNTDGYRYGTIEVEPDGTKSFINYLWSCLMDGMLNTVTGNGKKE
ncbi:DUF748 domain-containing protein [Croceitalea sp. MTPC5]|uniref:DUF748 domain-containing protein n=1 Tax=Croceitalea sp. MTPC5 TaxID=3056565 RepID=UPI0030D4DB69